MKILIAGDFVPQGVTARLIEEGKYETVFGEIPSVTAKADYSIVNLEAPVINGEPTPIVKSGPNLVCSNKALDAIKYAGFNCITLANNHFYDQGEQGVKDTIKECQKRVIDYVGGGNNIDDASKVLYKQINGKTLAIINCCEKEFSIADENHGGSNPMEPIRIYYSIKDAKSKAYYVLLITHGGIENYQYPYPQMQELYRFFIDAGADAVVNHHQHCPSGYEIYHGKPIFYGLGNFCFERKNAGALWHKGYMVILDINTKDYELVYYRQSDGNIGVKLKEDFCLESINNAISNVSILTKLFHDYSSSREKYYLFELEPIKNKMINWLQLKGLFPMIINNRQCVNLFNLFTCESHRNIVVRTLQKCIKNE